MHLTKERIENILALSPMQEGLLFQYLMNPGSRQYFEQLSLNLRGMIDQSAFRQAWNFVLKNNEMLRAVFKWEKLEKPVQIILKGLEVTLSVRDLSSVSEVSERTRLLNLLKEEDQNTGFDLATGPLFRITLCRLENELHEMIISNHHILFDGWSTGVILQEFFTAYEQFSQGLNPQTVKKTGQREYLKWMQRQDIIAQENYWREYLQGFETPNFFPYDWQKKQVINSINTTVYSLPANMACQVEQLSKQLHITQNTVYTAAWGILLQKYIDSKDILFGITVSGRPSELQGVEEMVGLFINTLPLRMTVTDETTVEDVLFKLHTDLQTNQQHGSLPLAKIKACNDIHTEGEMFDSLFVYENYPLEERLKTIGASLRACAYTLFEMTNYDLVLEITALQEVVASFTYNNHVFRPETIERLAKHFQQVVECLVAEPGQLLKNIQLISCEEERQLLVDFNQTATDRSVNETLMTLFERQVAKAPERVALVFAGIELTYAGLNARANLLARELRQSGVKPNAIVGIRAERSVDMLIGVFAILKAGGAYLPLDPMFPVERLEYILNDSGCAVLLTQRQFAGVGNFSGQTIMLDEWGIHADGAPGDMAMPGKDTTGVNGDQAENLPMVNTPEDLAYIIYTSGSTGQPKGVMVEHGSVVNTLMALQEMYPIEGMEDAYLLKTAYTFDVSVAELFGWMLGGGRLVILNPGDERDPAAILQTVDCYHVTHINFVPPMFNVVLSTLEGGKLDNTVEPMGDAGRPNQWLARIASLKYIFLAGEAVQKQTIQRFLQLQTGIRLENLYGPTEATIYATYYALTAVPETVNVPIGQPLANLQTYVLNQQGLLLPIGVPGELYIAGRGLARGYLHNERLTEDKFIPNPFNPGTRMYRTGDLVKWLPDGTLEYLGRIDRQVKIRGFRVELEEIDAHLLAYPGIKEAVTIAREGNDGTKYLCAYYVIGETAERADTNSGETAERVNNHSGETTEPREFASDLRHTSNGKAGTSYVINPATLVAYLRERVPEYMIPAFFITLDQLPLTTSGKIDRRALPLPDLQISKKTYIPPVDLIEETLAAIWADVLGVAKPGTEDNFFDLGGHSLKATRLATLIHRHLDVEIPLREIFQLPTIKELAGVIRNAHSSNFQTIQPVPVSEYYPVSSAQKRLFILHQFDGGGVSYNLPAIFAVEGQLDRERLNVALSRLIARHEALRTRFSLVDGEPVQKVEPMVDFSVNCCELAPEELARGMAEFVQPFDLEVAPLLRMALVRSADRQFLCFDIHHIIADGVSLGLIVDELTRLYNGEGLPELKIHYKDFASWQNELSASSSLKQQEAYWLKQFASDLPVLNLPTDFPRGAVMNFAGDSYQFAIDSSLTAELHQLARQTDTTLYMLLLATYKLLLLRYTNQTDIVVGSPVAGRTHADVEGVVGMFVNTLAFRTYPASEKTFLSYLAEVRKTTLESFENQDYQFEKLVDKLGLTSNLSRNPLFDVVFVLQNTQQLRFTADGFTLHRQPLVNRIAKFDLTLEAEEMQSGINFALEYRTTLFTPATIARLAGHLANLLREIVAHPEKTLGAFKLISAAEEYELLHTLNDTLAHYPREKTVQQIFEEKAELFPERTALIFGEEKMTYGELNARTNQVARQLQAHGAGPEEIIGILCERSLEMIVGILAVVKSGAAYLPIDPDYPAERIEYMLKDSGAKMLLTQSALLEKASFTGTALDLTAPTTYTGNVDNLPCCNKSGDLLYIIYTSGSTGKPKGVMIEHRNLIRLLFNDAFQFDFTENDIWTVFHSYSFDFSVWEMYGALLYGGTAVVVPKTVAQSPAEFLHLLRENQVTVLNQTPTAFYNLIKEELNVADNALAIRYVIFGGEALKPVMLSEWHEKYPVTRLINMYGITETTVHVTFKELTADDLRLNVSNIGRPIPTLTTYIMDQNLRLLPIGVPGELCVGGDGVGRGYLNRPELTAEKFVLNPYKPEEIVYRSGDLARLLANGDMEYLGRIDHQVKIRGFRIELGEIENGLLKHPEIAEVIVIPRENRSGEKDLVAYLVTRRTIPVVELRNHLRKDLPEYMVPAYFIFLEQMPLTANGKINRAALPEVNLSRSDMDFAVPETEVQIKLAQIWSRVLDLEQVGLRDNFFELGGDSIKAIRLANAIAQEMQLRVKIADLYQNPGLEELAGFLERAMNDTDISSPSLTRTSGIGLAENSGADGRPESDARRSGVVESGVIESGVNESGVIESGVNESGVIESGVVYDELVRAEEKLVLFRENILENPELAERLPVDWVDIYPMSDIQQGMVFHSLANSEAAIYHDQMFYQFKEASFDQASFELALRFMVEKHPILRTSFHLSEFGAPALVVRQALTMQVAVTDLSGQSATAQERFLENWLEADRRNPLVLEIAPLWRMQLFVFDEVNMGLLLVTHHAILDGWSVASFVSELINTYLRVKTDSAYQPEPLKSTYREFVLEQLATEDSEEDKRYWQTELADCKRVELPELAAAAKDVLEAKTVGYEFEQSQEFLKNLETVAARYKTSVKSLALAAYLYMFNMLSYENDLVVGLVTNSRPLSEDGDKILGCFLNTVPFRARLEPGRSWIGFVKELDEALLRLKSFERVPLVRIVEYIGESRAQGNPLFEMLFNYVNFYAYEEVDREMVGDKLKVQGYIRTNTMFDFTVETTFTGFKVIIWCLDTLFSGEQVQTMHGWFIRVLNLLMAEPESLMSKDQVISPEEKAQLLWGFNDTVRPYPQEKTIQQLFEEQVERTPDNIALSYYGQALSYRQLNARANQLARLLRAKGAGTDKAIAIRVDRSLEMVLGTLAIVKAGSAYLPIDLDYPEDRVRYMLADSGAALLLTSQDVRNEIEPGVEVLALDDEQLYQGDSSNLEIINRPDDLIYIIYTSGSTGKPKGVMIEHYSVNRLVSNSNMLIIPESERIMQTCSPAFDVCTFEIWGTLLNGATLYLISKEELLSGEKLERRMREYGISMMWLTAPLFNQLLEQNPAIFSELQTLILGGDALSPKHVNQVRALYPEITVINGYGPTECTTFATYLRVEQDYPNNVPIGYPLTNTQAYILSKANELQPIGAVGELCLGGDGLARGYLNSPELTAAKFVPHPFIPDVLMYRSGDLARWLPDGKIEFLGRIDNQVKVRGYRIELSEIESQILRYPWIKEAVVQVKDDGRGGKYICAYIGTEQDVSVSELKAHIGQTLPDYMIPSVFMFMTSLPLNSSGKIDYRALPEPDLTGALQSEYVAPQGLVEEKLAEIWAEVLKVGRIGRQDNFFELGGHSLKAALLVGKVNQIFKIELPVRQVFQTSTLHELAAFIALEQGGVYQNIPQVRPAEYYPLSSAQKRLYVLKQMDGPTVKYNMPAVLEVEGSLDLGRLAAAVQKLVARHEILRTSFRTIAGEPVQMVHSEVLVETCQILTEVGGQAMDEFAPPLDLAAVLDEFVQPFDLSRVPLFKLGYLGTEGKQYLLFDMDHIISDGVSMGILIRDLLTFYQAAELPELRVQYKDFASWQNTRLQGEGLRRQEEYWLRHFSDEIPVLNLWTDYPRPEIKGDGGAIWKFDLAQDLTAEIYQLAQANGATLYMVLLAALNVLLAKYSGQEDIIIGSPIAGRTHADLEHLIGMFVNTLALRNFPQGQKTFAQFLAEVRENSMAAFENQEYQFETLIQKLGVERDFSRNPLFDIVFVLQNTQEQRLEAPGLRLTPYELSSQTAKFDLTLNVLETGGGLKCSIEYSTELFKESTVARLAKHWANLLQAIVSVPQSTLGRLEILAPEEQAELLSGFPLAQTDYPRQKTLHQLFTEQVYRTPERLALQCGEVILTYRELNERANKLAHYLRSRGVGKETVVAIMGERSVEMVIGILAILKAGGAYLPIDPDYPANRIEYTLQDSGASIVLTQAELVEPRNYEFPADELTELNSPADLAYIIYTSGSTGRPKGVMIEHRNVVRLMFNDRFQFDFTENDVWTLFHSFCFDFSVWEMYGALLYGGRLVVVPKIVAQDTERFLQLLRSERVTVLNQTPSAFYNLSTEEMKAPLSDLAVRYIIFGGEALKPGKLRGWFARYPEHRLINMYGITETTVHVTFKVIGEREITEDISNIGTVIPTLTAYIFNRELKLAPIGVPGELCVGGDGVGRGYLNRPELTAEKFIENPYKPGERLYRSGDLVRRLTNGEMEYLGRIDQQVKIRGFRIELGEIEKHLQAYPGVVQAVVIDREDEVGEKYLIGYLVTAEKLDFSSIRGELQKVLPGYMVPAYLVSIDALPLTANGKIDRKALPEPELSRAPGFVGARDEQDQEMIRIWAEVLHLAPEEISIDAEFFELGGHSLKATALISIIRREFGVKIPFYQLFALQTIRELVDYIKGAERVGYLEVQPAPRKEYYVQSPAQRRLFILEEMGDMGTVYNVSSVLRLSGPLERDRLAAIFRELMQRHESLRTSFHLVDGEPVQKVHSELEMAVEYYTLEVDDSESSKEQIAEIIQRFIRPFDLSRAPLFRVGIIQLSAVEHLLVLDIHHIIFDGVSLGIFIKDFLALYAGEDLPALTLHYKDYAEGQNSVNFVETLREQGNYWRKQFSDTIPVMNLPADYPRPATRSYQGGEIRFTLDAEVTAALRQLAQANNASLFMLLLAIYNVLLQKLSGQQDIVVGTPIAGRRQAELRNVIGMFVNSLALRNYPAESKRFIDFLQDVRQRTLQAYENQDYQFDDLVEEVVQIRDMSRNPLFDTFFALQNQEIPNISLAGIELHPYDFAVSVAKFDLSLDAWEAGDELILRFGYCAKLFKVETVQRFVGYFQQIIREVISNPAETIAELQIIPEAERELLRRFNQTEQYFPEEKKLHQLFEIQAEKTPEATALVYAGRTFKYRELNEAANQLARHIRNAGIRPDQPVGLLVDISLDMVIGMLAILKAGGAFLPIDPEFPPERIEFMIADSGVELLLTGQAGVENGTNPLTGNGPKVLKLSEWQEVQEPNSATNLEEINTARHLAYVIYTSGSTGQPKGVQIEHRSIVNQLYGLTQMYTFDAEVCHILLAPFTFDPAVQQIFLPLISGGQVHLVGTELKNDVVNLVEYIFAHRINLVNTVPSLMNLMVDYIRDAGYRDVAFKYVILAGEVFSKVLYEKIRATLDTQILINIYGPTEATINTTLLDCQGEYEATIPIGRPLMNYQLYILDEHQRLLPIGVVGELCIGGVGLARGYLQRPELEAEKFIAHPWIPGERIYRTGDLARWLPDGNVEYIGRVDNQVKLGGRRIEPGEIEYQMVQYPGVKEAVVLDKDKQYLCGFYVKDGEVAEADFQIYLAQVLPNYMVPAVLLEVEKIPHTHNGKIDRAALLQFAEAAAVQSYCPPRTVLEAKLQQIFEEVLKQKNISIDDDFFRNGGNSLKAMALNAAILREFQVKLGMVKLFQVTTIRQLAQLIAAESVAVQQTQQKITPAGYRATYPTTHLQKRMWVMEQFKALEGENNIPLVTKVKGQLNLAIFQKAVNVLVERHESLRTTFELGDGELMQKIHPALQIPVGYHDLRASNGNEDTVQQWVQKEIATGFDLQQGPLCRLNLLQIGDTQLIFTLVIHHIIADGTSMGIFLNELLALYQALSTDRVNPLPELSVQYKDYAVWLAKLLSGESLAEMTSYWLNKLGDPLPILELDTDYPRDRQDHVQQSARSGVEQFVMSSAMTAKIEELCRKYNLTLTMVQLALTATLLTWYTGGQDAVVTTVVTGRNHPDIEKIIGFFVNTLALKVTVEPEDTLLDLLAKAKETVLGAYDHQFYPFDNLLERVAPVRGKKRVALSDVRLMVEEELYEINETVKGELCIEPYEFRASAEEVVIVNLDFSFLKKAGQIVGAIKYNAELFTPARIALMVERYLSMTQYLLENPTVAVQELKLFTQSEKELELDIDVEFDF